MELAVISLACALLSLAYAGFLGLKISKADAGTPLMREISGAIQAGSKAFLNREYKTLVVVVIVIAVIIAVGINISTAVNFLCGAFLSALSGNIGMRVATAANSRTAAAAEKSIGSGLKIAFNSGAVMGIVVVGLGVSGISIMYLIFNDPNVIYGFGFGASLVALFARVGGGIFTKGADVGADLVGKVEAGIPEDDPRNPAVIADNVGDNVGDVAGMGADLFESYVDSIIATMALGLVLYNADGWNLGTSGSMLDFVLLPLILAAAGIIASILGCFLVQGESKNPAKLLNRGIFGASFLFIVFSLLLVYYFVGAEGMGAFYAIASGLIAGVIIGLVTEYYTSDNNKPTRSIAEASQTGAGTTVITGLSVGMISTIVPILIVSLAMIVAYKYGGLYGIAISAVGMLGTLGITLATDTYGPVADNAAGIAEMAKMNPEVRSRAEELDGVGNTTAAMGKGFAIASAALTTLALFASYIQAIQIVKGSELIISLSDPMVVVGLFLGGMLPFLFCALAMQAVGETAKMMVEEVRRQFKTIKGLMEGKAKPDYNKCIDISTDTAIKRMTLPSLIAIASPIAVGLLMGPEALGGLLIGTIVTGFLLAIMMANSGGAWDNAKKYIEKGNLGGKGSAAHKAAVIGDTVGDPFKDTAGPSLNILIKLISIIAIVFAPLFV
ncbi:MAG: sodium-translocating pyrophosphatase [Candidatus Altiarchaeota archaeon]|nr:sodium-translocating pyrophosphatase [Candidatus Altiarchaeota archaeon]